MMKIPETSANVGAYYGNEENGQWQPNGVIIDNGVGGGVVGSGDAGMHRPPVYPVHIPRAHVPAGYVMAGAYYGAPYAAVPQPDDFADYMWMENEEEFDKQVLQQLEEEALMEQCIEAMLEDEQRERRAHRVNRPDQPTTSNGVPTVSLEEAVSRSTLNPLAAEFVPTRVRSVPPTVPTTEEKTESPPTTQAESISTREETNRTETDSVRERDATPQDKDDKQTEESVTPPKDPPEVSAADIHTKPTKKDKEVKKQDPKKVVKPDPKKKAPIVVKSETKVQPKKKEVKIVKSEVRVEEKSEEISSPVTEVPKPASPTTEEPATTGLKPVNYAAAARASKPKPKSTTPPTDRPNPQPVKEKPTTQPSKEKSTESLKDRSKTEKVEKKLAPKEKSVPKEKVNVQRKNSAK